MLPHQNPLRLLLLSMIQVISGNFLRPSPVHGVLDPDLFETTVSHKRFRILESVETPHLLWSVKCNWTAIERCWLHRDSRDSLFSFIYLFNLLCFRPWEKCYQVIRSSKAFPVPFHRPCQKAHPTPQQRRKRTEWNLWLDLGFELGSETQTCPGTYQDVRSRYRARIFGYW